MADVEERARWARAERELRAALAHIAPVIDVAFSDLAEELLDHNELGVAMDVLIDAALAAPATALAPTAIEHIRAASSQMDNYLPETWPAFTSRFE